MKTNFENKELCSKCGGLCCNRFPGACFPEDFDLTDKNILEKAIVSGKYAIDSWEGDPGDGINKQAYFVRPATKNAHNKIYDESWGGECVFLTPNGCELIHENRPSGCTNLEPKIEGKCVMHNNKDKRTSALAWRAYHHILENIIDTH